MNINEQIKKISIKNMLVPLITLAVAIFLLIFLPINETFAPQKLKSAWDYNYEENSYVYTTVDELYYSGYNISRILSQDYGYYYTFKDNRCLFFLIPVSSTPEETLENYKLYGHAISTESSDTFNTMISSLAADLNWNETSLNEVTVNYIISNADYYPLLYFALFIILLLCIAFCVYFIVLSLVYYKNPATYPLCPHIDSANKKRLIAKADSELTNNVVINVGDLYLTEHYFIEYNSRRITIIPLMRIIWCYRMGTFSSGILKQVANYNLYFTLKTGDTVTVIKKSSEQTQQILAELRKMNLGIILGYTDSKRKKAKKLIKKK